MNPKIEQIIERAAVDIGAIPQPIPLSKYIWDQYRIEIKEKLVVAIRDVLKETGVQEALKTIENKSDQDYDERDPLGETGQIAEKALATLAELNGGWAKAHKEEKG